VKAASAELSIANYAPMAMQRRFALHERDVSPADSRKEVGPGQEKSTPSVHKNDI
jgi:hypothetical protein